MAIRTIFFIRGAGEQPAGRGIGLSRVAPPPPPPPPPPPTRGWPTGTAPGPGARAFIARATEQPIDPSTAAGKCFLDMLGVFAEFETNLRRGRQLEGIAKAKAAGIYKSRPASIDAARVAARIVQATA
jgi:hypothetical protein